MSRSNNGMNAIYNGGLALNLRPQGGGSKILKTLDNTAKQIGFFRNVLKPITASLGINSSGINSLVSKGYGKKKRGRGRKRKNCGCK